MSEQFIPGWPWLDRPSVPRVVVVQLAREVWPGIVARDRDSPADAAREAFEYAEAFVKRAKTLGQFLVRCNFLLAPNVGAFPVGLGL
jgi:hypothetical protein